jgi:hypothetical protein
MVVPNRTGSWGVGDGGDTEMRVHGQCSDPASECQGLPLLLGSLGGILGDWKFKIKGQSGKSTEWPIIGK